MANPAQLIHGYALVGIFSNILLYGVMINQTFTYFYLFRKRDRLAIQAFVAILFLADTLNSVFNVWWIFNVLVNNFGNFEALTFGDWLLASDAAMTAIIAATVQNFFAWRVRILTQNIWITAIVHFLAFCGLVTGIGSAVINQALYPKFADFTKYSYIVTPWLAFCAACDVVITFALSWKLRQRSGFWPETDDILNKIIRLTIQNGALTSLCAVLDIIFYLTIPNGLHLTFNYTLAKLYSNSAMSSLNARSSLSLRIIGQSSDPSYPSLGSHNHPKLARPRKPFSPRISRSSQPHSTTEVYIDVETHEMQDIGPTKPQLPPEATVSFEEGRFEPQWLDTYKGPPLTR